MVNRLLGKFLGLFKKSQEYFLVIEQLDNHFEATTAKVNFGKKELTLIKRKKIQDLSKLRKPLFSLDRIIVAFDPLHATTIESTVRLKRSKPQEIISEAELDHLIFRGLWEFLNRYRGWSAKKMAISDTELVLSNIDIRDVGFGSRRVFNPLGFKGADFFVKFRGTFIPRSILEKVNELKKWGKDFILVEGPSIISASIPEEANYVVYPAETRTAVFSFKEDEQIYCKECLWGSSNITKAIANTFKVDDDVAQLILDFYINKKVSPKIGRVVDSQINREFGILLEMIESIYNKSKTAFVRPAIYFNFRFSIPPPEAIFTSSRLRLINFSKWLELQGYKVSFKRKDVFSPRLNQGTLALLTHSYSFSHYNFLNQLLRRRVKWLAAHP